MQIWYACEHVCIRVCACCMLVHMHERMHVWLCAYATGVCRSAKNLPDQVTTHMLQGLHPPNMNDLQPSVLDFWKFDISWTSALSLMIPLLPQGWCAYVQTTSGIGYKNFALSWGVIRNSSLLQNKDIAGWTPTTIHLYQTTNCDWEPSVFTWQWNSEYQMINSLPKVTRPVRDLRCNVNLSPKVLLRQMLPSSQKLF